jgi:hypothetical protein
MVEHRVAAPSAAAPAERPETPEALLRVVQEAWGRFSPEQRSALRDKLVAAGIVEAAPAAAEGLPDAAVFGEVKQRAGLAPAEAVQPVRLARMFLHQMEFFSKLDQLAWTTWRALAPRSPVKRDTTLGDMRLQTRRYLKGDPEPTDLQVARQIEFTRQLIAILLGSISQISRGYVKRFQTRYSPEAVQDLVKMEGGGGWGGIEPKCWRKYTELASEINEATVQNDMQEVVVKYVEEIIRPPR